MWIIIVQQAAHKSVTRGISTRNPPALTEAFRACTFQENFR
jgi:hypothetical protein